MNQIMIVAGEASGDMHAAHVAAEMKRLCPDIRLFGMGGTLMAKAGVELEYNVADAAVMGIGEVVSSIPAYLKKLKHLKRLVATRRPNALLLVDFPEFNMRLARYAHQQGMSVVYYIPPKAWAWRGYRARQIAQRTTVVASIFPFEADFYRKAGANVEFVGNPLLDFVDVPYSRVEARCRLGLEADIPIIGLMPGSRRHEVERLLPVMLDAAAYLLHAIPNCQFVLPLAPTIPPAMLPPMPVVRVFDGQTYPIMRACDLMIIGAGTATLEAACLLTPMIIIAKVSLSTWILGRTLVRLQHAGLPNIVAGREIVPELLQNRAQPQAVAQIALNLLNSPERVAHQQAHLRQVRERLGSKGTVARTAQLVLNVAELG